MCYFHDLINDYYTIEHPLTQRRKGSRSDPRCGGRYLKVLERQRLDLLCLRTKPSPGWKRRRCYAFLGAKGPETHTKAMSEVCEWPAVLATGHALQQAAGRPRAPAVHVIVRFRNLQIPCQSCGVMQSTLKCNQPLDISIQVLPSKLRCLMSFCRSCADALHKNALGPRMGNPVSLRP